MAIEHADLNGIERLALVTGAEIVTPLLICMHVCFFSSMHNEPHMQARMQPGVHAVRTNTYVLVWSRIGTGA